MSWRLPSAAEAEELRGRWEMKLDSRGGGFPKALSFFRHRQKGLDHVKAEAGLWRPGRTPAPRLVKDVFSVKVAAASMGNFPRR